MPRPRTERSLNAVNLEAAQPEGFPEAFQRLVDARNADRSREGHPRLYARDLHEEAITELVDGNLGVHMMIAKSYLKQP